MSEMLLLVARSLSDLRKAVGWSQVELGRRAGLSQPTVSAIERARVPDLTFSAAVRLLDALGARMSLSVNAPFVADRGRQLEPVHARSMAHVRSRLQRAGWLVRPEVEVEGARSHGWIDLLAFHPSRQALLIIEVKTELHDLGAIERTLGWYERESWVAARRIGWRPRSVMGGLFVLATEANELRIRDNRDTLGLSFPIRADRLDPWILDPDSPFVPRQRALAMIDPLSRKRRWLGPARVDGRRSPAPYLDYADCLRRLSASRPGRTTRSASPKARSV